MNHDKLIPGIIALAGGQITTRIRLRMIHYLLDQKGMQSGLALKKWRAVAIIS